MISLQALKQRFEIIGNNTGLNRALEKAIQVAPTDISLLVTGESGVGKSSLLDAFQGKRLKDSLNFEMNIILDPAVKVYRIFHNPDHQIIASTVSNEITFAGECKQHGPKQLKEILDRNLKYLPDYIDPMMNPGYLSGGEKELLNLVTALDFDPDILLIDDGLSFLSDENKLLHGMKGDLDFD